MLEKAALNSLNLPIRPRLSRGESLVKPTQRLWRMDCSAPDLSTRDRHSDLQKQIQHFEQRVHERKAKDATKMRDARYFQLRITGLHELQKIPRDKCFLEGEIARLRKEFKAFQEAKRKGVEHIKRQISELREENYELASFLVGIRERVSQLQQQLGPAAAACSENSAG